MTTILLVLGAVYLLGVVLCLLYGGLANWRSALLWPVVMVAFTLFWRHD